MTSNTINTTTVSSLLSLYRKCNAAGDHATLSMECRGGRQVVCFSLTSQENVNEKEVDDHKMNETPKHEEFNQSFEKHEKDVKENEKKTERIIFPAQYSGPISAEKAAEKLRKKWPLNAVRKVTVRKTAEAFDDKCGLEHLEVVAIVKSGVEFDDYFARPANDRNWPRGFVPAYICNCKLYETRAYV